MMLPLPILAMEEMNEEPSQSRVESMVLETETLENEENPIAFWSLKKKIEIH